MQDKKNPAATNGLHARSGSRRRWRSVALGGVITASMACGPAIPAMAAAPAAPPPPPACNTAIIDATAGHVLNTDNAVTKATANLQSKGVDVRIRVFTAAPGGSLDGYETAQVAGCPSWSFQGGIKPNLLVFLVSLDHQDAIFYGANYSRMQGQVDQIRANMGGDFRGGDFAAGIAKGEQEAYSALYSSGAPAWLVLVFILGGFGVLLGLAMTVARRGGRFNGPGSSRYTYISTGGAGFTSGGMGGTGGTAGGSSGSW